MEEISLYGAGGKPRWFLKLNAAGTVPVLNVNNGESVYSDSETILDFIASGDNSLTQEYSENDDVALTAKSYKWRKIVENKILPIGKKAALGGSKDALFQLLDELENEIEGPYLCGDSITVADCCAFPFIQRINEEFGVSGKMKQWLETCKDHEGFSKTIQRAWWWWW
jgi:glutathione S-transferase